MCHKTGTACANETLVDAWKRQMQESSGASGQRKNTTMVQLSVDDICEMNQERLSLITNRGLCEFPSGKIL